MSEFFESVKTAIDQAQLWRALGIAGAILLTVTVFIVFISAVVVKRGEVAMSKRGGGH